MWQQEAEKYWKKSDDYKKRRRQFQVLVPTCTLIFALLSIALSFLWPLPRGSSATGTSLLTPSSPLTARDRLLALSTDDRLRCQSEGQRLVDEDCASQCSRERDTFPRPTVHRACQDSCRQAGVRAVNAVCQSNEVKCWDVVGGECGVVCEEALHKYPSARTFDVCRRHCRAIVKSTCAHRVEWLKGAIRNK